ncbi:unnamed protein product [Cyclocybe aegerita]|uniref:DNA mismatch repair protein PMS1 n=1 Tax=Cyclocybe aegerita TaxID=1973307 RepID=A0A8S0XS45_CYCAE|nr:unnamed protein product [Cyclocybe aegerita]
MSKTQGIKAIDRASVHRITSGQVVIDLQTAVKELLENSIDAGAANVEVRFKQYGLKSVEVVDDGSGISEEDYDSIALKHHTSKLETFTDLASVASFGFRGEALSSLCALSEEVTVCTATVSTAPMGVSLIMDSGGKIKKRSTVARQPGTTVTLTNLFSSLPVRRKEFERNLKREFGKALTLLSAYALGPCCTGSGVRLSVSNQPDKGPKAISLKTQGSPSSRASVTALWGPKSLDNIIDMDISFEVERDKATLKRLQNQDSEPISVRIVGLISKFSVSCGRTGTDRQFFYVNGRPCNLNKIQKAFNEVYRSFNATQAPFILADFILPTECYDVNVSPDKRTILLHSEGNLILALKAALEAHFAPSRSTYDLVGGTQKTHTQTTLSQTQRSSITRMTRQQTEEAANVEEAPSVVAAAIRRRPSYTSSPPPSPPSPSFNVSRSSAPSSPTPSITQPSKSDTFMDLDEPPEDDDPVVLDPSQSSWGRQLSVASRSQTTTPALELKQQPRGPEEKEDAEPPRKKRKSELGLAIVGSRQDEQDDENKQEDVDDVHRPVVPTRQEKSPTIQMLGRRETKAQTRTTTATSRLKGNGSSSNNLRQQLLNFARPGSQLPTKPTPEEDEDEDSKAVDDEEECADEDQEATFSTNRVGGLDEDEEVDQLEDDPPTNHDADITGPIPKKPSRTVANTSDRPSSPLHRTQDHGRDDGTEEGEDPVDLTAGEDDDSEDPSSVLSQALVSSSSTPSTLSRADKSRVVRPEVIRSDRSGGGDISLRVDVDKIRLAWTDGRRGHGAVSRLLKEPGVKTDSVPLDAGIGNVENDEKAVSALARVIEKDDFATMDIVGQFNLGFIVVRQRKLVAGAGQIDKEEAVAMDDLFIVDQHAADEKYNFETLQTTTRIQSQKLFKPQQLEVTAADEMLALENLEVLRQNGFEIDVDDEDCVAVGQGSRLKLTAQPVSKSTVFNMKDLEELIHLMRDRPSGQMVRCSKARAMFASRACRKSVMVGMPLTQAQMTTVVHHMGTMDQPWNCPHGRPTMRHLSDIRIFGARRKESPDWSSFA